MKISHNLLFLIILLSSINLLSCLSNKSTEPPSVFLESKSKIKNNLKTQSELKQSNSTEPVTESTSYNDNVSLSYLTMASADPTFPFYYKSNINCSTSNCYLPNGVCVDKSTCKCLDGWAIFTQTSPITQPKNSQICNYKQKKQVIAFLLEFFFPYGMGHLYAGRVLMGVLKLVILLFPLVMLLLACFGVLVLEMKGLGVCAMITLYGSVCTLSVWALVDFILFGTNAYKDGNGVPLAHW